MKTRKTSPRICEECKREFLARVEAITAGNGRFCSRRCTFRHHASAPKNLPRGEAHPHWKGDAATEQAKRKRAARLYQLGKCEKCGGEATDRHHKDGDTGNNAPSNIALMCRRCHMQEDGRMGRFRQMADEVRVTKDPQPCVDCGHLYKPLRRGRCNACAKRMYAAEKGEGKR